MEVQSKMTQLDDQESQGLTGAPEVVRGEETFFSRALQRAWF